MHPLTRETLEEMITSFWSTTTQVNPIKGPDVTAWLEENYSTKDMRGLDLRGIDLAYVNLSGVDLRGCDLLGANLSNALLHSIIAERAVFMGVNLDQAECTRANFSGVDLRGASVKGTLFTNVNFRDADLRDIRYVSQASFKNADLEEQYLKGMDFSETDLSGANLKDSDLRNCLLEGSNLEGAQLAGADLQGAILRNVQISNATGLIVEQLVTAQSIEGIEVASTDKHNAFIVSTAQDIKNAAPIVTPIKLDVPTENDAMATA